jgi:hypothetical protein
MNARDEVTHRIAMTVQRNHTSLFRVPISDMMSMTTDILGRQYVPILMGRTKAS